MTPFQQKAGHAFKVRVSGRRAQKSVVLSTGTPDETTARRVQGFVKQMKARRRWDVIDALLSKRLKLAAAYDAFENNTLEAVLADLATPDLDPLVTEWSKTTNAKYVKQVRSLVRSGEAYPASRFTRNAISRHLASLACSGSTKVRYRAALSVFAGWLVEREVLGHNPVREVKAAKANPSRELYLEREQAQLLISTLPAPYSALEALMAGTGMERQAVQRLTRRDIDLDRLTVHAHGSKTPWRNRTVRITEAWTLPYLEKHLRTLLPGARVFTVKMDRVLDQHKKASKRLDLPQTTLHDWRHTYAVNSLRDGMKPTTVARQLGHRDASLVHKVYGRFIVDERDYELTRKVTTSATTSASA